MWLVISRVTVIITHIRGLITPLITTHEPPSRGLIRRQGLLAVQAAVCCTPDMPKPQSDVFDA